MNSKKSAIAIVTVLTLTSFLISSTEAVAQAVKKQEKTKIRKIDVARARASIKKLESCHRDLDTAISRVPVESGKQAYIWPDDQQAYWPAQNLLQLVREGMESGDTLYLRPGTYESRIFSPMEGMEYRRIHIRGSGARNTIVKGYIWAGSNSTIKDLTIDNTGEYSDKTSLQIDLLGATIENVIIIGGRNGILVGNSMGSTADNPVTLDCVTVSGAMYNGIMIGDERSGSAHNSRFTNVSVSRTGRMGLAVNGDGVVFENLRLFNIGTGGLKIVGNNARVNSCQITKTESSGLDVVGNGVVIENLRLSNIGTNGLKVGGNNARINNCQITNTENMGVMIEGNGAILDDIEMLDIGSAGLKFDGANNRITNSSFRAVDLYGISLGGVSCAIDNVTLHTVGTRDNGTGVIIYEDANNYVVRDSTFDTIRIGINVQANSGRLVNNTFDNMFYRDVLGATADETPETITVRKTAIATKTKPIRARKTIPKTQPQKTTADNEPPSVSVKVDGILIFTLGDRISIIARAEDNVGVSNTKIYIDGRLVKTCSVWECRYSQTLTETGLHSFYATAQDKAGNTGKSETLQFMVHPTSKPGPSLNIKAQPYKPTTQDRVTFIADAAHSAGVESVTIHVNGRVVKTCNTSHCEYTGGPYPAGRLVWKVSAKSRDGGVNMGHDIYLDIKQMDAGTGSISGKAYGRGAGSARAFFVALYGPDNFSLHRDTKSFDQNGRYSFTGLPNGRYKLIVDTRADIFYAPHPSSRIVTVTGGAVNNIDFEIK